MLFSEASSLAQSAIFSAGVVEGVHPHTVFHNLDEFKSSSVDILSVSIADSLEYPFLDKLVAKVKGKIGRLLFPGRSILPLDEGVKIGTFSETGDNGDIEVMIGDETLRYPHPKVHD
jgi:hypothetical protein